MGTSSWRHVWPLSHLLQAGRNELQVHVLAAGRPLEPTVATDAKVDLAQRRQAVESTIVQRLLVELGVVMQATGGLAVGGHVQLEELTVFGRRCET